jgi:DNA-directed RNA polymerase II subunit RPB11
MKIKVLEEKKNRIVFESEGLGHTFCNLIKKELWNDSHVKVATYSVRHPSVSNPEMIVETDGSETPRNALLACVQRLKRESEKFRREFRKEVR